LHASRVVAESFNVGKYFCGQILKEVLLVYSWLPGSDGLPCSFANGHMFRIRLQI